VLRFVKIGQKFEQLSHKRLVIDQSDISLALINMLEKNVVVVDRT
jgi:hypothetical protein